MWDIWDEEFWRGASEKFSETGRLFAFTGTWGDMNQNWETSWLDGERRQVCRTFRWYGFSLNLKLFTAIKKVCVISFIITYFLFCDLINSFWLNLFLCHSKTLSFSNDRVLEWHKKVCFIISTFTFYFTYY